MKSILIIGNGKWANKILDFVVRSKIFDLVYIKTRNENFILKNKEKIKIKYLPHYKKINTIHVCSPIKTHYGYVEKLLGHKNLIIEKPFLNNFEQFQKIKKKVNLLKNARVVVNYIDLYSPLIKLIKKECNKQFDKIIFEYSDPKTYFKKKYLCIEDWLEHPLSLVLFLFKRFTKFKIVEKMLISKNSKYLEKVKIKFLYKKKIIMIEINFKDIKKRKIYFYKKNKLLSFINLRKTKMKNKIDINNLFYLYKSLSSKKKLGYQSLSFYEKILVQRINIVKSFQRLQSNF